MTNSTTSIQIVAESFIRTQRKASDNAPMVITRLSGWIDIGEVKTEARAWIIPTRVHSTAK